VDVAEFLALAERGRRELAAGRPGAALTACTAALALWGEPLPEDTYADWARPVRERLARVHTETLEVAARAALAVGDAPAAVGHAEAAVAAEPLRESAALVLARASAAGGDRAAALSVLAAARRRLAEELGVDPSAEAVRLQRTLLAGGAAARPRAPVGFAGPAFVGRDAELARLRAAVAAGEVATVAGPAGVGKSRLVAEAVRGLGRPVVAARAVLPERAEAWSLARSVLREVLALDAHVGDALPARTRDALSAVVPELPPGGGTVLDGESRRALVLAGGLRMLESAAAAGCVLVVDDLQWADPSSLDLLTCALARLPALPAVVALRAAELSADALAGLRDARGVVEVSLGPLPAAALDALAGDRRLAGALRAGTDGSPFAVAEVLRELAARGEITAAPGGGWTPRGPGGVALAVELGREGQRRAVRRRAERETGLRAEVLALVALLAREAPASTVAAAAGRPARAVLDALSGLAGTGLLRLGEQGWACAHDLVGETVTAGLPPGERGRLHGLLAAALAAQDADPSEIARHHREAGDGSAAAAAYERAARRALDGHATREAAALADAGLALDPGRTRLLDVRAEARAAHGDVEGALADLRAALDASGPGADRSRRLSRLAMVTMGARDPGRAAELAELALVEAGGDDGARSVALETAAILDMNLGRPERAAARAGDALALHRRRGDGPGVARILDGRAMATFLDGRITEGVGLFDRVATLFEDSGDLLRAVTPRSTRGHGLLFLGRAADGLADTSAALQLARDLDAPEGQAYALWHRSEVLSGLGRAEEGEADAREALRIARRVAHRGWTATAWMSLGLALHRQGRLDEAAAALRTAGEVAGDGLTLFASMSAARAALVAVAQGRLDDAAAAVARALGTGPRLGHYEARWAAVELAAARGAPGVREQAAAALAAARAGGHLVSASRLAELASPPC
jgi:tetratricopeptide (TPR) repeat protein